MDPNRPTDQQQPQSQAEGSFQLRRQSRPASSQSNGAGTSVGHSDAFITFPEPGTTRSDIGQSSVPAPLRRATPPDFQHESDAEAGPTSSLTPMSQQPERPNIDTSSPEVTPLPPVMFSSRRSVTLMDNNLNRTLHNTAYSAVPMRESRRTSLGPEQLLDRRSSTLMRTGTGTELDWVVPVEEKSSNREKTVAERLNPTLLNAIAEKTKYASKARLTGYALNIAIGLQVLLGSLTTALSVVTKGSQTAVMTAILGGFSTVVASYLARARGSNEPELSITRVKDLEQFIRECESFKLDHGHATGDKFDKDLEKYRGRFEELLGNANGERRLSSV